MKNEKNNRYFQIGINGLICICGGVLFYYILFHTDKLTNGIYRVLGVLKPIIAGFAIAYVLSPVMMFFENRIIYNILNRIKGINTSNKKIRKIVRFVSSFLSIIVFALFLYSLVIMVVPQIITNIQSIIDRVPTYFLNISSYYTDILAKYPKLESLINSYIIDMSDWFSTKLIPFLETTISKASTSILGSVITIFQGLMNFIIGVIVSLYLLIDKEKFQAQFKKVMYAFWREQKANNFINNIRYANKIFGGFIAGKVVDSIIIGIICYIGMLILKLPYAALISVIIGVTNVIPYFGPIIGAVPSAFIILLVSPKKCLILLIFILVLQQFDGNILGPKILGESTGLNSFWVIFSITVFSGLFGIIGMFLGVPIFAVIYAAFKTFVNERLLKKNMPVSTEFYINSDFKVNEDEIVNDGGSFRFLKSTFENITPVISDDEKARREQLRVKLDAFDEKDDDANI